LVMMSLMLGGLSSAPREAAVSATTAVIATTPVTHASRFMGSLSFTTVPPRVPDCGGGTILAGPERPATASQHPIYGLPAGPSYSADGRAPAVGRMLVKECRLRGPLSMTRPGGPGGRVFTAGRRPRP